MPRTWPGCFLFHRTFILWIIWIEVAFFFFFLIPSANLSCLQSPLSPPSKAQEQQIIRKMSEGQGHVGNPPITPALSGPPYNAPVPIHSTLHLDSVSLTGVAAPVLPSPLGLT